MRAGSRIGVLLLFGLALIAPSIANGQRTRNVDPDAIRDVENRFTLQVPASLQRAPVPTGSQALHFFTGPGTLRASVTRFDAANRAAYQRDKSAGFVAQVQRGLARDARGFTLRSSKFQRLAGVPVLDLEFLRTSPQGRPERGWMRFVFRFRFTVVATATVPAKTRGSGRRAAKSFTRLLLPWSNP